MHNKHKENYYEMSARNKHKIKQLSIYRKTIFTIIE